MIFRKKRRMIDVRELQKRGVVKLPVTRHPSPVTPRSDSDGFIEFGKTTQSEPEALPNTEFFGFIDTPTKSKNTQPTQDPRLKAQDSRITALDNQIYKLEQRIELLEKKLEVNQPTKNVGPMGW